MTDDAPELQCESCGNRHPEPDMNLRDVPGTTLAFCDECAGTPRSVQYGVGR